MYEIDKQKFGAFIASLRREKGLTQKELARQLFISDKAVSKWNPGVWSLSRASGKSTACKNCWPNATLPLRFPERTPHGRHHRPGAGS